MAELFEKRVHVTPASAFRLDLAQHTSALGHSPVHFTYESAGKYAAPQLGGDVLVQHAANDQS
jgi:hypothetical protein